ncbi:uncharacterized protein K444DRAFT_722124, partial [Hyaloscypha bicolor E]
MPKPLGAISIRSCNYIFMLYIEGDPFTDLWPNLLSELKSSIRSNINIIIIYLKLDPILRILVWPIPIPIPIPSILTKMEFKVFLVSIYRKLNQVYLDLITSILSISYQIIITYSNLYSKNILVLYTALNSIKITGLVDWEFSRVYPEYWEYIKAL